MAETSLSNNLSALIQIQRSTPTRSSYRSSEAQSEARAQASTDDSKALEAAKKFEALLIHNMLKGMRKTTLSENTSNERALYDDMLDEKLATTLMDAGGLGVAQQIAAQIRPEQLDESGKSLQGGVALTADTLRIRELAQHIGSNQNESNTANELNGNDFDLSSLAMLSSRNKLDNYASHRLNEVSEPADAIIGQTGLSEKQGFLHPLLPYAKRSAVKLGTSPEAILAIAALETGWGKSIIKNDSGNDSHNLFGIKASGDNEPSTDVITTEYVDGRAIKGEASFRVYKNPAEAVDAFANFILENPRYSKALEHAGDPERFLQELQSAGYATDPNYASKAISVLKQIESQPQPL